MDREEAINILHGIRADNLNLDDAYTKDKYEALNMAIEALENQKTGHWIFKNDNIAIPTGYYQCSECEEGKLLNKDNFCPNCGAKMEGDKECRS